MCDKIFIIQKAELVDESKAYFNSFSHEFPYLNETKLVFPTTAEYSKYSEDLKTINRGWSEKAELIDTRNLEGYEDDPVRILLTDNFFKLDKQEQNEITLHELGHYFTNPSLQKIRDFIAIENPRTLSISGSNLSVETSAHNEGLNYIFQIPKMVLETNAELWIYENEISCSEPRIFRYCESIENSKDEFNNAKVNDGWFFRIPRLNFLICFRLSILKHSQFKFTEECLKNVVKVNEAFFDLAERTGWRELKIFVHQSEILKCIDYKNEDIERLCLLYHEIFNDYIKNSVKFFPMNKRSQILKFYDV